VSRLIELLQEFQKVYGDLPVLIDGYPVEGVERSESGTFCIIET
jgi:hypothetical protein